MKKHNIFTNDYISLADLISTNNKPRSKILPLIHISDLYYIKDIFNCRSLKAKKCSNFNNIELLYSFYGKPAYRSKHNGNILIKAMLPVCFILDTAKLSNQIYKVFPCDTGAFSSGLYNNSFHEGTKLKDLELRPDIRAAQDFVDYYFLNESEYYKGGSRKNVNYPELHFEAEGMHNLTRSFNNTLEDEVDERSFAVEVIFKRSIDLAQYATDIIVPQCAFDSPGFLEAANSFNFDTLNTYLETQNIDGNGLAGIMYQKVGDILSRKGLI